MKKAKSDGELKVLVTSQVAITTFLVVMKLIGKSTLPWAWVFVFIWLPALGLGVTAAIAAVLIYCHERKKGRGE